MSAVLLKGQLTLKSKLHISTVDISKTLHLRPKHPARINSTTGKQVKHDIWILARDVPLN